MPAVPVAVPVTVIATSSALSLENVMHGCVLCEHRIADGECGALQMFYFGIHIVDAVDAGQLHCDAAVGIDGGCKRRNARRCDAQCGWQRRVVTFARQADGLR